MPTANAPVMTRSLCGLCLALALNSANAQQTDLPASCAAADSVFGTATARDLRAPVLQSVAPDGTVFIRTGTRAVSTSRLAVMAWQPTREPARAAEIALEISLPAERAREILQAQDSLLLVIDDHPPTSLGVPTTARIDAPIVISLPLFGALSAPTLLALARAESAEVRIRGTRARFTATDRASIRRLARLLLCTRPAA